MSLYTKGLSVQTVVIPSFLTPYRERVALGRDGAMDAYRGGQRFYRRGLPTAIGAVMGGTPGTIVDGLVHFILDTAHIFLLLAGLFAMWKAIT